jgi:hypothetical protein
MLHKHSARAIAPHVHPYAAYKHVSSQVQQEQTDQAITSSSTHNQCTAAVGNSHNTIMLCAACVGCELELVLLNNLLPRCWLKQSTTTNSSPESIGCARQQHSLLHTVSLLLLWPEPSTKCKAANCCCITAECLRRDACTATHLSCAHPPIKPHC